jgi:hypothetical protein
MFRAFFRSSSGAQICNAASGICQTFSAHHQELKSVHAVSGICQTFSAHHQELKSAHAVSGICQTFSAHHQELKSVNQDQVIFKKYTDKKKFKNKKIE